MRINPRSRSIFSLRLEILGCRTGKYLFLLFGGVLSVFLSPPPKYMCYSYLSSCLLPLFIFPLRLHLTPLYFRSFHFPLRPFFLVPFSSRLFLLIFLFLLHYIALLFPQLSFIFHITMLFSYRFLQTKSDSKDVLQKRHEDAKLVTKYLRRKKD